MNDYIKLLNSEDRVDLTYAIVEELTRSTLYLYVTKIDSNEQIIYNHIILEGKSYLPIFTSIQDLVKSTGEDSLYLEIEYAHIEPLLRAQYSGIVLNPDTEHSLAIERQTLFSIYSSDGRIRDFRLVNKRDNDDVQIQPLINYIGRNFPAIREIIHSAVILNDKYSNIFLVLLTEDGMSNSYIRDAVRKSFAQLIFSRFKKPQECLLIYDTKPIRSLKQNPIVKNIVKNILPSYIK